MRGSVRLLALAAVDAWAIAALRPDAPQLVDHLAHPDRWAERAGIDAVVTALASAFIWLLALWLAIGLLAAVLARAPGALGQASAHLAAVVLPRGIYRVVAGATGLGVLLTPVAAAATTAPGQSARASAAASAPAPTPTWPTTGPERPLPIPAWPTSPHSRAATPPGPSPRRTRPPATPPPATPPAPVTPGPSTQDGPAGNSSARARVVVRRGDSLWLIAANRLGANADPSQIATEWPRWYAANRDTIGPDPNLLLPGQVLQAPIAGAGA